IPTPFCLAPVTVSNMTSGSPPWKPQATLADETIFSISASLPIVQAPKLSPMSQFRSITSIGFLRQEAVYQYSLYGRNLPLRVSLTWSSFGSGWRSIVMSKSIALMMPSPNSSWINSFQVVPLHLDELVKPVDQRIGRYDARQ